MFESATFASSHAIHDKAHKWMVLTLGFNTMLVMTLIIHPLIFPESLSAHLLAKVLYAPAPPSAPAHLETRTASSGSTRPTLLQLNPLLPPVLSTHPSDVPDNPPPTGPANLALDGVPGADNPFAPVLHGSQPPAVVHPSTPKVDPTTISKGVAAGLLIYKIAPLYPAIARISHTSGTVILAAVISKSGAIEDLHVVSGPPMLQQPAIDAVKQWRYRPYLLNNEPVAVETTVNVVFSLGNQ